MITITNAIRVRGKLTGDKFTGTSNHKVRISITGRKDLTRFAKLIGATAQENGDAELAELSARLQQPDARGLNITMPAEQWAAMEQQIVGKN